MAKQKILPFFIPMEGCPYRCVYCDQVAISGKAASPTAEEIISALEAFESDPEAELAFYGGSFTCLDRERQQYYLDAAAYGLKKGIIGGIRISTRPDAVDDDTCAYLRKNGVVTVELGVQSFDDEVLHSSGRCYSGADAAEACRIVASSGIKLGVQLMTGLPKDSKDKCLYSVRKAADCGGSLMRIYPTLVLKNTALAAMYEQGKYLPQQVEEAVAVCGEMSVLAHALGLTLIRVGINTGADVEAALAAGPYHPAFGGLVKEEIKQRQISMLMEGTDSSLPAVLTFPPKDMPLVFGDRRMAMCRLAQKYPQLGFIPDGGLAEGAVGLTVNEQTKVLLYDEYCRKAAQI